MTCEHRWYTMDGGEPVCKLCGASKATLDRIERQTRIGMDAREYLEANPITEQPRALLIATKEMDKYKVVAEAVLFSSGVVAVNYRGTRRVTLFDSIDDMASAMGYGETAFLPLM